MNPIDQVRWSAPEVARAIDRRVIPGPTQVMGLPSATRAQGRRGEHSVAMLLKRYANCIDGQQALADERIAKAFGDGQV